MAEMKQMTLDDFFETLGTTGLIELNNKALEKLAPKPEPVVSKWAAKFDGFTPSKYQDAVFDWIVDGRGDGIVNAVAGGGKSTTLVQAAQLIKAERAIFCAFNKHIAVSLGDKLAGTPMQAKTIHSIGNGVLYKHLGKTRIDGRKYFKLAKQWCERQRWVLQGQNIKPWKAASVLAKLGDMARLTLTDENDRGALVRLARRYVNESELDIAEVVIGGVPWLLAEGVKMAQYGKEIDFTDMIWLPNRLDLSPAPMDWVFVDECQDLNAAQLALVLKMRAPGGRMLFVGDPKQAIMGFAGADARSFWTIKERTEAQELPLSVCYRCPTSHLDLARKIVPHIEARDGAPVGVVKTIKGDKLIDEAHEGDLILCRVTAPLIKQCMDFIAAKVSARVRGRDIGKELSNMIKNIVSNAGGFVEYTEFGAVLDDFEGKQIALLARSEGNEGRIEALTDKCDALRVCWTGFTECKTLDDLCNEIEDLFSDDRPSIWLSTVHRAKGLEEERVFIIEPGKLPLRWENQRPDEFEQEMNLKYVALTRAKSELIFVE